MDWTDYRKAYTGMLSIVDTLIDCILHIRYASNETAKIYRILKTAEQEAEDSFIEQDVIDSAVYEAAFNKLNTAIQESLTYAKKHKDVHGGGELCQCLSLISVTSVVCIYPPENAREAKMGLRAILKIIMQPKMYTPAEVQLEKDADCRA